MQQSALRPETIIIAARPLFFMPTCCVTHWIFVWPRRHRGNPGADVTAARRGHHATGKWWLGLLLLVC